PQVSGPLPLLVDGPVDRVAGQDEHEGNHMGHSAGVRSGQAGDPGLSQTFPSLPRVHAQRWRGRIAPPPWWGRLTPSSSSRATFRSRPPVYPPRPPPVRTTRWHGTTIGTGFAPSALPAARTAPGLPTREAMSR